VNIEEVFMAPRAFWKGYLKLSLVTCRVTMTPARSEGEKVRFHNLNAKTHNRVVSQYVDALTGKPVDEDDQVKGYERAENDYVLIEDDELEDVGLESTRTIDIDTFVPLSSIGWIWLDRPHFLAPDDKVSDEAFSMIRAAMAETDTAGIARLVMYRRERAVMLAPQDKGIVVWTLRYGDEVRDDAPYYQNTKTGRATKDHLTLLRRLIRERTKHWSVSMAEDPVQDRLLEIIKQRKKGAKKIKQPVRSAVPGRDNVIDIMSALKKSIAGERKGGGDKK
jgi:DNA end-binding protein Ku